MFKVSFVKLSSSSSLSFQMLCGTEPYPTDFKAKKYKLDKHSLSKVFTVQLGVLEVQRFYWFKADFWHIMKNLPVQVSDEDIEEMFEFADKDRDGQLSYQEFLVNEFK